MQAVVGFILGSGQMIVQLADIFFGCSGCFICKSDKEIYVSMFCILYYEYHLTQALLNLEVDDAVGIVQSYYLLDEKI